MLVNRVKQALREGRAQLGTSYGCLRSPEIARILAAAGFHWAFIDAEHGSVGFETVADICRACNQAGLCPVVRVADLQYDLVARALDNGAQGIMLPRMESPELLEKAISWTKYPPVGVRGFGLTPFHVDYAKATIGEIMAHMNEQVMVVFQIETMRGFEARHELLSVPGVDAVMIGPVDFSIALGHPGDFLNPKVVAAMEAVRDACVAKGVAPGTQTRNLQLGKFWRERGMRFLGCSSEVGMMFERGVEITSALA
ncbi:MAG: aldolase/citrate lyase family protein [Bryobacteraceae bacterium]|nr:aldolase/citrate lyase family protein [Bryobacteraceae bacterium]MDW8377249.1 aldolase/citrate lyase family protein [Bryobacterales bacterium]